MTNYLKRRQNLLNNINDENFLIVFFSGKKLIKTADQFYDFCPNKNFFYLTGIKQQNLIFLVKKTNQIVEEFLFIERQDPNMVKWVGKDLSKEDYFNKYKIENVKYTDQFEKTLSNIIFKDNVNSIYLDLENRYFNNQNLNVDFFNLINQNYPYLKIKNIYNNVARLRTIKDDFEIEKIKKAIDITNESFNLILKNCKPNMFEFELEAFFDFKLKQNGIKQKAFDTILASGKNATILHYDKNNCKIKNNDLILLDFGATFDEYSADISRTFPANGKFSERQKLIYNIVLNGQKKVIDSIRPNVAFKSLNQTLINYYAEELKKIGLIKDKNEVEKYYYHSVSHLIGLDTHDVNFDAEYLKEGMVLTVEPGLYIEDENIGIRIEDDVLVTKDGFLVLSKNIIKSVEDIERFMQEDIIN